MSDARVRFTRLDGLEAAPGAEQAFSFSCPNGRRCASLVIAGRTNLRRDPQGKNGGIAQWDWNGDRAAPTFTPSIDCASCWHGFIEKGRCVSVSKVDEPEPPART